MEGVRQRRAFKEYKVNGSGGTKRSGHSSNATTKGKLPNHVLCSSSFLLITSPFPLPISQYDQQKGDPGLTASIRNAAPRDHRKSPVLANGDSPKSTAANVSPGSHRSPHDILKANGSTEAIRERNVTEALIGFFGLG